MWSAAFGEMCRGVNVGDGCQVPACLKPSVLCGVPIVSDGASDKDFADSRPIPGRDDCHGIAGNADLYISDH